MGIVRTPVIATAVVAAVLTVLGVVIPFLGTETESGRDKCHLGAPSGTETEVVGWSWWPYGTKCRLTTGDGQTLEEVVPPWRGDAEWREP